ncbi:MAG: serine/threonine protein kinase [Myxococcales bacterium]|nr:serine/threonine protein kinase [Myxococcales bacterium]
MLPLTMAEAAKPPAVEPERRPNFDFKDVDFEVNDEIPEGTILVGRYRVLHLLGGGGMGTVYLAEHLTVGRKVAIKVLNGEWSGHSFVARRFRAEARTASAIGHPGIVEVFDAGELPDKRLFLVMEHLDGHDVAQELAECGTIAPARACEILRQVALGLGAAHAANIIHRDLKPGNIMIANVQGEEIVKILDFGIACNLAVSQRDGQRLTLPGSVMGTPEYMSPEQSTGGEPTPRFDLYALGAIAYEMLTGDPPMLADHSFELLARKRREPSPSLATRAPDLPAELVRLVDDCLEIQPSRRPVDAAEFITRLDSFIDQLSDEPVPYVPLPPHQVDAPDPDAPDPASRSSSNPRPVTPVTSSQRGALTPPTVARRAWIPLILSLAAIGLGAYLLLSIFDLSDQPPAEAAESVPSQSAALTPDPTPAPPQKKLGVVDPPPPLPDPDPIPVEPDTPPTKVETPGKKPPETKVGVTKPHSKDYLTPDCERTRSRADEARRTQAWSRLRDLSRKANCWQNEGDARKLQTKAAMELRDFSGCISSGKGLKDEEVVQWLKLCRQRAG